MMEDVEEAGDEAGSGGEIQLTDGIALLLEAGLIGFIGGIIGLGLFWIVTIAGLLILVRWLPSHGKHASEGRQDTWSEGPGLSVLAHVGMLVGVVLFTFAYLTNVV